MTVSLRMGLDTGIAILAAGAVAVSASVAPPPPHEQIVLEPRSTHSIELTAAVWPSFPTPTPDVLPTLSDQVQRGIVPSLGAVLPTPDIPAPAPAATDVNQAIKNIYNAAEPWVRYGFELATYAVGWVPYVGWLSPQIMIFYNFGERIVRSITFNLDDWVFGSLPFIEGLANVARDSWNALVQLGIDEWNFWLPPLPPIPPFPLAAQTTTPATATAATQPQAGQVPAALPSPTERVAPPADPAKDAGAAPAPPSPAIAVKPTPGDVAAEVASPAGTVTTTAKDLAPVTRDEAPSGIVMAHTQDPGDVQIEKTLAESPQRAADQNDDTAGKVPTNVTVRDDVAGSVRHATKPDANGTAHDSAPHADQTHTGPAD